MSYVLLSSDDKAETGEEKGDPGVATQNNDSNAEEDLLGPNCYYDKSKSFFDNISSELKSRWVFSKSLLFNAILAIEF